MTIVDKITDAVLSTECLAAFLGAFAAFLLEALRRRRADKLQQLDAGSAAIFDIAQMYTAAMNVCNQKFADRFVELKDKIGRDPNYAEFLPMEPGINAALTIQTGQLTFLLRSHFPELLNRLASASRDYSLLMQTLNLRNSAHYEWQEKSRIAIEAAFSGRPFHFEELEQAVGLDLCMRLRQMTEGLQIGLPLCAENLKLVADQLHEVLSYMYPTRSVPRFIPIARTARESLPKEIPKPSRWRRVVRYLSRVLRKISRLGGANM